MTPLETTTKTHHLDSPLWRHTPDGAARGYIDAGALTELWVHTGTACNLRCPFCLEGSKPGDMRIEQPTADEVLPYLDEAVSLGCNQFSFTGGEPFASRDILLILDAALERGNCLVLTNATNPLRARMDRVTRLRDKPHGLRFRVSLDYPDPARHDGARGDGNFAKALETLGWLHAAGFGVSVARLSTPGEDAAAVNGAYAPYFASAGLPETVPFVAFPDFLPPGAQPGGLPHITESCMTTYHTAASRDRFMCHYSRMVVKKGGRMGVYACTLVDDDEDYALGVTLKESLGYRVMLRHHRCFSCFAQGASCSESH